jgi:thiol-disulfide isomerase/thioredoxin
MKKKIIITILLAFAANISMYSQTTSALPSWERKSAPAVIMGRHVDWGPGEDTNTLKIRGNKESLKGLEPEITQDSIAGTFTIVWDICYPIKQEFDKGLAILLFPDDTVRLDIDRGALAAYETYNKETPRDSITTSKLRELWKKAVHIEGASFELPLPIQMKGMSLGVSRDYSIEHAHDTFDEWREVCWNDFQDVVRQLDTLNLSTEEKEYRRMLIEQDYLNKLRSFMFVKKCFNAITDEDSLAMFEKQFTFKDPHAPELTYYRKPLGFFACMKNLFDEGRLYIQANGLEDSPLGRWFKELGDAKTIMTRVKTNLPVAKSELNALSSEFQTQIREVQAQMKKEATDVKGTWRDLPEGEPQEWLPKIVAAHKGHIVFIDFWATWCGPCRLGMKEMESVKDELVARGVDFVYITDTSSDTNDWAKNVAQHAGDHYIVAKGKMNEMEIPEYNRAIPHYLIYDRNGKLVKAILGWESVEYMMQEFEKVE